MAFDVTFKGMGETAPRHLLHFCSSMERAVQLTKEQYPGCLVVSCLLVS
jgi:hypothetical protein